MITRFVKMTFDPAKTETFLSLFAENRHRIAGFEGCLHLELQRDVNRSEIFFTVSRWRSEADLENYRKSELFNSVWAKTKLLFAGKPEAWTLQLS